MTRVLGLGGDAWSAPEHTLVAYWAALAAGADGLAVSVRGTSDRQLICAPGSESTFASSDYQQLDAGAGFKSQALDADARIVSEASAYPWRQAGSRAGLRHLALDDLLRNFGRRTFLLLRLPEGPTGSLLDDVLRDVLRSLTAFGLLSRVWLEVPLALAPRLRELGSQVSWIARLSAPIAELAEAASLGARAVSWSWDATQGPASIREAARHELEVWLSPSPGALGLARSAVEALCNQPLVAGVMTGAVLPTLEALAPRGVVFRDSLERSVFDPDHWSAGLSHLNGETRLYQEPTGFRISIASGESYSGGALVTRFGVPGDFDAEVEFRVKSPQQATTFELAAIGIDPPYTGALHEKPEARDVNLTFDVHGAPPYASSERDEDDGFRFGWNNSSNLTRILEDWSHASANMYNRYGRDVGSGRPHAEWTQGRLRLVRSGQVFASYYTDATTVDWVCSGAGPVSAMPSEVFLRMGAKHWHKQQVPPANEVIFRNFLLRQA